MYVSCFFAEELLKNLLFVRAFHPDPPVGDFYHIFIDNVSGFYLYFWVFRRLFIRVVQQVYQGIRKVELFYSQVLMLGSKFIAEHSASFLHDVLELPG